MSSRLWARVRRLPLQRLIEAGAIGIALWCILFIFQLLPGKTADTEGLLVFGLTGMAIRVTRFGRYLLPTMALGMAIVLFVSVTSLSNAIAARWVREDSLPDSGIAAVVVLSAGINPNGTLNGEALDHLLTGLELTREDSARILVTTTVQQAFPTGVVSSQADQSRIVALFGGRNRWIHTRPGKSTRDEAVMVADSLLPLGIARVAIVASPMHTRRACGAFEAVGFVVTCFPARSRSPGDSPGPWPRDRLAVFGDWIYELAGTVKYRMKGWLGARPTRSSRPRPSTNNGHKMPVALPRHTWRDWPASTLQMGGRSFL